MSEVRELSRWTKEAIETVTEILEECETMRDSLGPAESWRVLYLETRMYGTNIESLKHQVRLLARSERISQDGCLSLYSLLFTLLKLYARLDYAILHLKHHTIVARKEDEVGDGSSVQVHRKAWDRKASFETTVKVARRDITRAGKYRLESTDGRVEMDLYCRVVGSTVMIRVGGGWEEVSDFLKNWRARSSPPYSTTTTSNSLLAKKSRSMECMSDMGELGSLKWSRIEDD